MFDYSAIAALNAIIETQGFEAAARKLFITQSAISQRIKALENYYGEPVLIRSLPYQPTSLGQTLLGHYKRVMLLEDLLHSQLAEHSHTPRISIAISRDSLETWFVDVMDRLKGLPMILEIIANDQEVTIEYLRQGLVSACASTSSKNISGGKSEFLGFFDYVLVCSPDFRQKYFTKKNNIRDSLLQAPCVIFDNQDYLHQQYLEHFFNITPTKLHQHVIPSVAGFRQLTRNGCAYALIPEIDILNDLKQKKLINLFPDKVWEMPIYWHTWNISTPAYDLFNSIVKEIAYKNLRQRNGS